jgi:hypothetical protein
MGEHLKKFYPFLITVKQSLILDKFDDDSPGPILTPVDHLLRYLALYG